MLDSLSSEAGKARFGEPAKFLPVVFVCANILILWVIYTVLHCLPLLAEPETADKATTQTFCFNVATAMLVICYIRCILTHPGTIPDKEPGDSPSMGLQETKRSGDRRHCKWCAKYKPDRCHHCRVCRTCILRMDHHCPWIYNCVGFANHKFFFLLLFYSTIATHLIIWSMCHSVRAAVVPETPFLKMFLLLFGETLACFLGFMVTVFFCFHIWLMLKAMTTIEFCEKSMKRAGYDATAFDRGVYSNLKSVLGEQPLLWLLPVSPPIGDGLGFATEETPLLLSGDMEAAGELRKKANQKVTEKLKRKQGLGSGTGECSDLDAQDSDDCAESPRSGIAAHDLKKASVP